ncbi:MAG TPA: hypothetical protein VER55_10765, partial [Ardenticatenaceae bacterium]|nr:hypothetical protein [Ardenticatenaceae bacterium]
VQGTRLAAALERAQIVWPWLGAMVLLEFQPAVPRDDPRWGLALRGADERPTPLGRRVGELARGWVPGPGHWPAGGPGSSLEGEWLHFRFLGSETVVELRSSEVPALRLNGTEVGGSLRSGADGWELRLSPGALRQHELSLRPQAAARGFVVSRNVSFALFYTLAAVLATVGLAAGLRLGWLVWTLPWGRVAEYWRSRSETTQIAVVAALLAAFYLVPDFWLSLVLAGALWLLFVARLDLGLAATVLAVPFFLLPKPFFALRFSLVELLTLLCLAAWGWRVLWQVAAAIRARRLDRVHAILVGALVPRDALDWGMLVFLVAGAVSPLWSHVYGVAAREFRVVVLEPMLFYWLVRRAGLGPREQLRLVDTLVLSAVALSIHGLYQWFFTVDIIRAEGVHRARAVYGSPNNLALFLDRVVPLVIAFLPPVADRWNRRARLYAFALAVMGPALFLTFTRGAWLLAIPASLFFIAWRRPGLPRRAIVAATLVAVLALIPFAGTERL